MSVLSERVQRYLVPCPCDTCKDARYLAAFADGPVADTAEPVAAEAGRPIAEPDGNHGDAMPHKL